MAGRSTTRKSAAFGFTPNVRSFNVCEVGRAGQDQWLLAVYRR
jgi:hypothetical protein